MLFLLQRLNGNHVADIKHFDESQIGKLVNKYNAISIMEDRLLQMQIDGGKKSDEILVTIKNELTNKTE